MTTLSAELDDPAPIELRITSGRHVVNAVYRAACLIALGLVILPTGWMVYGVVDRAVPHWRWSVLTRTSSGQSGGLSNAVVGSVVLTIGVLVVAGTVSVLTGLYIAEFSTGWRRGFLRGGYEILAGIPSIVLGYVGYIALVVHFHWGFSLLAGIVVLSVLVVPYIAKNTEASLAQVPSAYREGADALGLSDGWTLRHIVLKSATPGIVTGLLVAVAIAAGETAPLLYTAGWSDTMPTAQLTHAPVGYLTYPVWTFYNQPSAEAKQLSYDAALLLIVLVLLLIGVGRAISAYTQRHADR